MVGLMRHRQTKGPVSARLYLNRRATPSTSPQNAIATAVLVDPESIRPLETRQRLRLGVASVAGFRALVDHVVLFRNGGRISNPALLIENADLLNPGLGSNRFD